jgi:hypothetical protein
MTNAKRNDELKAAPNSIFAIFRVLARLLAVAGI